MLYLHDGHAESVQYILINRLSPSLPFICYDTANSQCRRDEFLLSLFIVISSPYYIFICPLTNAFTKFVRALRMDNCLSAYWTCMDWTDHTVFEILWCAGSHRSKLTEFVNSKYFIAWFIACITNIPLFDCCSNVSPNLSSKTPHKLFAA